jgi:hypothetical protein
MIYSNSSRANSSSSWRAFRMSTDRYESMLESHKEVSSFEAKWSYLQLQHSNTFPFWCSGDQRIWTLNKARADHWNWWVIEVTLSMCVVCNSCNNDYLSKQY